MAPQLTQAEINARCLSTEHLQDTMGRRSAKGGAIAVFTQLVRILIQLVGAALLARLLEPADFGLVAMASTVAAFVWMFGDLGLSVPTIQRKDIDQNVVSTLFFVGLAVSGALGLLLALLSPLAASFFRDPRVGPLVIGLALSVPLAGANAQHSAILTRAMRWGAINLISVGSQLIGLVVAVLLAWLTPLSFWVLVVQAIVTPVVSAVATWTVCRWRPSPVLDWAAARRDLGVGLNLTGFTLINYFHRQLDNVLIGRRWGAIELGFYSRSYSLMLLPLNLVNFPVGSVIIPLLSRCQDNPEAWRDYLLRSLAWISFAGYGIASILILNADALIRVVLGPGWERSSLIFSYLAISLFGGTPLNAVGWIYVSIGRTNRMLRWSIFNSALIAAAFFLGLPYGAPGVALCYGIAICLTTIPALGYAALQTPVRLRQILRVLIGPGLCAAGTLAATFPLMKMLGEASPLLSLFIGSAAAATLFLLLAVLVIRLDPAQIRQRQTICMVLSRAAIRFRAAAARRTG